jgi:cytochrome c-type biogenesis protein CcmE
VIKNIFTAEKISSLIAVFGLANIPLIKFSVIWWNTLHQPASIKFLEESTIHESMLAPLMFMFIAFAFFSLMVFLIRFKVESFKLKILPNKKIRIGGMVKKDSINEENKKYNFIITDFNKEISVTYSGILPNLFVEGQGAVVEGNLISRKTFVGTKILAKHDENYMPKEVADSLKKIGNFKRK